VRDIPHISRVIEDNSAFNYVSVGFIDLSKKAFADGSVYWPILLLAIVATVLAYYQAKQILPEQKEKKKLRDILKASSTGKQPEQEDMAAAMGSTMVYLMPLLTLSFGLFTQGAMVMYLLATSAIGIVQQSIIFKKDTDELEEVAGAEVVSVKKKPAKSPTHPAAKTPVEKVNKKGKVTTTTRIISPTSTSSKGQKPKKKRRKK
jgi:membrane protein insertase Oxa1/YidC/SpoIIIJ